jgi:hypothetical protein
LATFLATVIAPLASLRKVKADSLAKSPPAHATAIHNQIVKDQSAQAAAQSLEPIGSASGQCLNK